MYSSAYPAAVIKKHIGYSGRKRSSKKKLENTLVANLGL
jgi:hypothetical protein